MDEEKDNSNIEEKVTISDLTEKAAAMKQEEPKPKKRIGLGIMLTVLALLLVGGALAAGYLWGNNTIKPIDDNTQSSSSKTNNETTAEPENNKSETAASTELDKEEAVISVAQKLKDNLNEYTKSSSAFVSYDKPSPVFRHPEMEVATAPSKAYGVYIADGINEDMKQKLLDREGAFKNAQDTLLDLGFKEQETISPVFGGSFATYSNDNIVCEIIGSQIPFTVGCSHIDWFYPDDAEFINSLGKAYADKGGDPTKTVISANSSNIKDSSVSPYQTLTTALANAAGLFYRDNPNSEWKFFTATQAVLSCSEYSEDVDAENVIKAFADSSCYNEQTRTNVKVSDYSK